MKFLQYILAGRPMQRVGFAFQERGFPVYLWQDCYGRYWMAMTRWGFPRVEVPQILEPWMKREGVLNAAFHSRSR